MIRVRAAVGKNIRSVMGNKIIFHIALKKDWERSKGRNEYRGDTLDSEGFIHCSTSEQIDEIAQYLFKGKKDLVLLEIDEAKVKPKIKFEDAGNGKLYPHIYGPLNIDAVVNVRDFYVR